MFILNGSIINVNLTAFYISWSFSRDLLSFSSPPLLSFVRQGQTDLSGEWLNSSLPWQKSVLSSAAKDKSLFKKKIKLISQMLKLCFS